MRLKNRCTIERQTQVNTTGNISRTWAAASTSVPCLLQEQRGTIQFGEAGAALQYDAICFFKFGTDLKPQAGDDVRDRLVFTKPTRIAGATFLCQHITDESGMGRGFLTAFLRRERSAA